MPTILAHAPAPSLYAEPPTRVRPSIGYFQKRWPAALILGSFPLLAAPMAAVILVFNNNLFLWTYVWLLGMTHFVVTLAIYLRSENLRYFLSSRINIAIFFAIPAILFIALDIYHALRVGVVFPIIGVFVLGAVRLADFNHFSRQSFGVLQLFKVRTGTKMPVEFKRTENLFFCALTGLMFATFLAGGVCPLIQPNGPFTVAPLLPSFSPSISPLSVTQPLWIGFLGIATGLFVPVAIRLHRAAGSGAALGYFVEQTLGALASAAYFPLYPAALAVHYVEYHVLMAPRCLHSPLDPHSPLDRAYGNVRSRPILFYGLVIAVAGIVTLCARAGMGMMGRDLASAGEPVGYLALIALFDGLFVFHYFIEMFIWKFGDPHFRKELNGLYFTSR